MDLESCARLSSSYLRLDTLVHLLLPANCKRGFPGVYQRNLAGSGIYSCKEIPDGSVALSVNGLFVLARVSLKSRATFLSHAGGETDMFGVSY